MKPKRSIRAMKPVKANKSKKKMMSLLVMTKRSHSLTIFRARQQPTERAKTAQTGALNASLTAKHLVCLQLVVAGKFRSIHFVCCIYRIHKTSQLNSPITFHISDFIITIVAGLETTATTTTTAIRG